MENVPIDLGKLTNHRVPQTAQDTLGNLQEDKRSGGGRGEDRRAAA